MNDILVFLRTIFNVEATGLSPIEGGERSRAFYFLIRDKKYVFRKNRQNTGFLKDKFAENNFGKVIPIPRIVKMGVYKDEFFAISEYCDGVTLSNRDLEFSEELVNNLFKVLDNIHCINGFDGGFGVAYADGKTQYKSWSDWVLKKYTLVTRDDGSFYTWEEIKNINFVDKAIIENAFVKMATLLPFVPNTSSLIHGDFATGNIIVDRKQVLGVIDWNEFGYGDFLYDLAWLDFWTPRVGFVWKYLDYCASKNVVIPNYTERIKCHQLFIGLTALGLYAAIGLEGNYNEVRDKVVSLLK